MVFALYWRKFQCSELYIEWLDIDRIVWMTFRVKSELKNIFVKHTKQDILHVELFKNTLSRRSQRVKMRLEALKLVFSHRCVSSGKIPYKVPLLKVAFCS